MILNVKNIFYLLNKSATVPFKSRLVILLKYLRLMGKLNTNVHTLTKAHTMYVLAVCKLKLENY